MGDQNVKTCTACKESKPSSDYYRKTGKKWRSSKCKRCFLRQQFVSMLRKYGLTVEAYDALVVEADGKCPICLRDASETGRPLVLDHCHKSQRFRGLICWTCNTSLGLLKDDPQTIRRAAAYVELHKTCPL